jgi:uncharacterized protein (TIGR03437 family)
LNTLVFASLLMALSGAQLAPAQTLPVAQLAVQSGNGQAACNCAATLQRFQPISVIATDANGHPVAGATVTWTVTSGQMTLANPTSITGADGTASVAIQLAVLDVYTSSAVPYLVSTIQASTNNISVIFTETQSLITPNLGSSVIQANPPTLNGTNLIQATLSTNAGTTLATPIQVQVTWPGNGVPNISVRILNNQTAPALSCGIPPGFSANDFPPYADPGSVLSDTHGNANCYPAFSGSGTGTFYVLIGGMPGATDISSALYLQAYGPYPFTSNAGAPAKFQIVSGNNQIGIVGAALNPLVAQLQDANGNGIGGQTVVWSVIPAGAVGFSSTNGTTTDASGMVSQTVSLDSLASAGAQITVALQSNPSISATFQETVPVALTSMTKIQGDGQTAQTGATFPTQLVVQINTATGPAKGYPVQFQVSNSLVSLLEGTTINTDVNGRATVTAKAGTLTGTATVTAVAGALNQTFTLTVTSTSTAPPPNGMTIVTGNSQNAIVDTTFISPLVVQVNSTAGPVAGYVVSFSATGPINISTAAATTNSSGQASITLTAGAVAGAATVTASISGYSQVFNLTVLPIGPTITASSFLNAASGQVGAISPCGLATISAAGLAPNGTGSLAPPPIFGRLPLSVNNLSVTFAGTPAPIVNVAMGSVNPQVTLQVPCGVTPGSSVPVVVNVGAGTSSTNVAVQTVSPGIFQTVMSDGTSRAVVVRDDGTFADIGTDLPNYARLGEKVRIYVTGVGPTLPAVATNSIQDPNADLVGSDATITATVQVNISGVVVPVVSARLAPDLIGVYEVQFLIPSGTQTGNNVVISVLVTPVGASSATQSLNSTIPIQ